MKFFWGGWVGGGEGVVFGRVLFAYLAYAKLFRQLGIFSQRPPPPEDYVKYIVFNASTV
jgi:hypothetical protein